MFYNHAFNYIKSGTFTVFRFDIMINILVRYRAYGIAITAIAPTHTMSTRKKTEVIGIVFVDIIIIVCVCC